MPTNSEATFDVLWPLARATKEAIDRRERLSDLEGKRIAFIWDHVFRGDQMFDVVKKELRERGHDVEFVDYEVFGDIHGAKEREVVADIPDKLREYRVDAAIVGVGA